MSLIQLKVTPPPGQDFITGIPSTYQPRGPPARLEGIVEISIDGPMPIKAKWLMMVLETVETTDNFISGKVLKVETVGPTKKIWSSMKGYDKLYNHRRFKFRSSLSSDMLAHIWAKQRLQTGLRCQLIVTLCFKGMDYYLRKEVDQIRCTSVSLSIFGKNAETIHFPSGWPQLGTTTDSGVQLEAKQEKSSYGPDDNVSVHVQLRSLSPTPVLLRTVEMRLFGRPVRNFPHLEFPTSKEPEGPTLLARQEKSLEETLFPGDTISADLACLFPRAYHEIKRCKLVDVQVFVKAKLEHLGDIEVNMPARMSHWMEGVSDELPWREWGPETIGPVWPAHEGDAPFMVSSDTRPPYMVSFDTHPPNNHISPYGPNSAVLLHFAPPESRAEPAVSPLVERLGPVTTEVPRSETRPLPPRIRTKRRFTVGATTMSKHSSTVFGDNISLTSFYTASSRASLPNSWTAPSVGSDQSIASILTDIPSTILGDNISIGSEGSDGRATVLGDSFSISSS